MTQELTETMQKEMCVKIAEAGGLKEVRLEKWCGYSDLQPSYLPEQPSADANYGCGVHQQCRQLVHYYLSDLNAMHDAVMSQSPAFRKAMRFELYEICGQMEAHDATAPERAKAFLRVAEKLKI